ncbi:3'(2'),5'-bisphosphate nucleotidase CysQ [Aureimonas phyllosphaerae]|uniref:Myo-inositol-1(Or 4)-monophosphatase n=1 Tax=Aureimonas phyllosphaerae TaxID=1166078 RepID=A0A7W6FVH6_9HYPH|nr:3'(2'),5'-bisphosphate nucleotidase CysQ [Aureimonas phyllosphaerae]MBB3936840.1 myo-inositol-1(or 4)-monophosphatase [Aureimonas phyllosphaerae]MBB3961045.1 myo-inositol-1(or 4)-monophosphatase [Aureimonas phyllosphaerae]SFF26511.1 myo-inositol-1(or 4)-monophosphatase [Aureimonas phyllosphaerae]
MTDALADLDLLREVAAEAGRIAARFWRRDPRVWWKGQSPVSEADLAVDAYLSSALLSARPGYGWISEETAARPSDGGEERFFVVDPIDGTRAFLRGEPTWCVSIAVVSGGRPVAGVLDAPSLGEVFAASADGAAELNGTAIAVRSSGGPGETLHLSMPEPMRRQIAGRTAGPVDYAPNIPSLALRLAMVACGRLDGTLVGARANDWDIAAADLILERAGGVLAGLDTGPHLYNPVPRRHGVLVAGAPDIVERLRAYAALAA